DAVADDCHDPGRRLYGSGSCAALVVDATDGELAAGARRHMRLDLMHLLLPILHEVLDGYVGAQPEQTVVFLELGRCAGHIFDAVDRPASDPTVGRHLLHVAEDLEVGRSRRTTGIVRALDLLGDARTTRLHVLHLDPGARHQRAVARPEARAGRG